MALNVGTLVAGLRLDKGSFDSDVDDSERGIDRLSGALNVAAGAAAAAGAASEGFARQQLPLTEQSRRIAASIDEQESTVRDLAVSLSNVTRPLGQVLETMEVGRQQGLRTTEQLEQFVVAWDTVGDATGENADELARASPALAAVGIEADNVTDAFDAFGYIQENTTHGVGEFMEVINRIGPEIRTMGLDVDDTAAIIGAMQGELGATGRVARREFQQAVREADGDLNVMLDTLGLTEGQFQTYRGAVSESSGVIERNAALHEDSYTVMQRLQSQVEVLMFEYGTLAEAASMLSPILMGAGGTLFAVNQIAAAKARWAATNATVSGSLVRMVSRLGPLAAAMAVVTDATNSYRRELGDLREQTEGMDLRETVDVVTDQGSAWEGLGTAIRRGTMPWRGATESWAEAQVVLEAWRGESDDAADSTAELTAEVAELSDAERSMRTHMEAASQVADHQASSLGAVGGAAGGAARQFRDFNEIMRDFVGDTMDAEQATSRWYDQLDSLTDGAIEAGGGIDITTEAGRENRQAIRDATSSLWGMIDGQLEQGATIDELVPKIHDQVDAFRDQMIQAGLTEDEVDELIDTYNLVPDDIVTEIRADERATSEVEKAMRELGRIPGSISTAITAQNNVGGGVGAALGQLARLPSSVSIPVSASGSGIGGALREREHGGSSQPGVPYLVGERRPEVFVPDVPGRIVPSVEEHVRGGDGASAGGAGGVHIDNITLGPGADPSLVSDLSWQLTAQARGY